MATLSLSRACALIALAAALILPSTTPAQTSDPFAASPNESSLGGKLVLVLPFDNRSGQPNLNWIAESFTDTLDQRLRSSGFLTITRDDRLFALDHLGLPLDFKPSRATTLRIAQTLDADYVIVGSFTLSNNRIAAQAQVLEVNKLQLSNPLDDSAELARLLDLENAIAYKVARQIDPHFPVAQQTFLAASSAIKLDAFESYIRGIDATASAERIKRLQSAIASSPKYPQAQLALGKAQFLDRQFDAAAATLAQIPQSDPLALEAGFYIGLARFNSAKYADAENAFSFVASRLPLPEVVNNQGVAAARQGKDGAALFQRASATDPQDPDYHFNLAVALYRRGDLTGARNEVQQTIKLHPADVEAPQLLAAINSGQPAPPVTRPGTTSTTRTTSTYEPVERIRRTYSEAGFRQAAFQLDQVRAMRLSTLPPAEQAAQFSQLGRDYLSQGLVLEAERQFQAAVNTQPTSSIAHAGLAQVRERSGDPGDARKEAEASLRYAGNVPAYLVLARIDLNTNQLAAAAVDVSNALRLEPANAAALALKQALAARGQTLP